MLAAVKRLTFVNTKYAVRHVTSAPPMVRVSTPRLFVTGFLFAFSVLSVPAYITHKIPQWAKKGTDE